MGLDHEEKQFINDLPKAKIVARKAGEEVEPVPPAGGEVDSLDWLHIDDRARAHVTRLTAENAQLQEIYNDTQTRLIASMKEAKSLEVERDALQSELTKARELLESAKFRINDLADSLINACEDFEGDEEDDPKAREECSEAWAFADAIGIFLAHQSAPAAKDSE